MARKRAVNFSGGSGAIPAAKDRKRALVLSGGGAKGVFEAGCLQAFKLCEVTFDVVTGSSIGALNAAVVGEYWRRRRTGDGDPERFFDEVLSIWEDLESAKIVDVEPLEPLVEDLQRVDISLGDVLRLWWGLTSESTMEKVRGWLAAVGAFREVDDVLDISARQAISLWRDWQSPDRREAVTAQLREYVRGFLRRHGIERGLFDSDAIRRAFTRRVDGVPLVAPDRTLGDFYRIGVDVRFTRANVRTGRLEISGYFPLEEIRAAIAEHPDRALSKIVGDPNAIEAALASGAFPAAFPPVELSRIYPPGNPTNDALRAILGGENQAASYGLSTEERAVLSTAYPRLDDIYLDGGAIDNSPMGPAIAAIKDAARRATTKRAAKAIYSETHDVFVIFLGPKPQIVEWDAERMSDLMLHDLALRALDLMQNATLVEDARNAERVSDIMTSARSWRKGQRPDKIKVNVVRIYPEKMLTSTLVFDRRFGFSLEKNRELLAMGCWTVLETLYPLRSTGRLPAESEAHLKELVAPKGDVSAGQWRCTWEACRVRGACHHAE